MPDLVVRDAAGSELGQIAQWLMEEAERDPFFRQSARGGLRGWLFRRVVVPRYLRSGAETWALEQEGQLTGFAVVEPRGQVLHIAEAVVRPGFDRIGLIQAVIRRAEAVARDREYDYIRTSPMGSTEEEMAPYRAAGLELLDYYLWAYTGQARAAEVRREVTLRPLPGGKALERRLFYLRRELEASQVAGRELVEASLLPNRPPTHRAYEVERGGQPIGYYAPRPNERGDGVLTLVISLLPAYWGSELEVGLVADLVASMGRGQPVPLRVLLSTTAHCEKADAGFAALGLQRQVDIRPVFYKRMAS
ncbi:MAG: hypothetical protein RMN53_08585 [Anaerolineae bacterium]|nr:hypothetical protein [Anaerolineae bacterium]